MDSSCRKKTFPFQVAPLLFSPYPFLDRSFVQVYLSIPDHIRCHKTNGVYEKHLLRSAIEFMKPELLPNEILWRTKEAFSDGVSSNETPWYKTIQNKIEDLNINTNTIYQHLQPQTPEQYYYRSLFESFYPNCGEIVPYFWMPKYVNATDPSARTLFLMEKK